MPPSRTPVAPESGYQAGPHPSPWEGPLAALDILLNNLGVGLFLVAAVGLLVAHDEFSDIAGIAIPAAFAIIALDLLLLVVDLGDPFRFFHMLRVIKPRTPMSVGVWALSVLMILLMPVVLIFVVGWFTDVSSGLETLATIITAIAIVPAIGAITYKGVLFSVTAQPGWRDARWLGAYVCTSGPALGSSVMVLIAAIWGGTAAVRGLQVTTVALIVVSLVALGLLWGDVRTELRLRISTNQQWLAGGAVLLPGLFWPLAFLLSGTGWVNGALTAASLLLAGFVVRLVFVSIPHSAPRAIPRPSPVPVRPPR